MDRDGRSQYLIADIQQDAVWRLNTTTDEITYGWRFHNNYNQPDSDGKFPQDWTHLNDVERLPDGRFMLSPRNHDQVVFLKPGEGIQENWTLGTDDDHETLYEQHSPDYVPTDRGGPAVVVADSQNNRVVEYHREAGEWVTSWVWQDSQLKWPRDADRLPSGNTLITDTHGNRVIEVNKSGSIVWSASVGSGYDAERLGTADESNGGESARELGLSTVRPSDDEDDSPGLLGQLVTTVIPTRVINAFRFVTPGWMGCLEALTAAGAVAWLSGLFASELYYSPVSVRSPFVKRDS